MTHQMVDELTEEHHTTVWCSCGRSYVHPDRQGALKRLETHLLIADTRATLKGDNPRRTAVVCPRGMSVPGAAMNCPGTGQHLERGVDMHDLSGGAVDWRGGV